MKIPTDGVATVEFLRLFVLSGSRAWAGADKKKSNPTNHMHPGRRRCFYLAVAIGGPFLDFVGMVFLLLFT